MLHPAEFFWFVAQLIAEETFKRRGDFSTKCQALFALRGQSTGPVSSGGRLEGVEIFVLQW